MCVINRVFSQRVVRHQEPFVVEHIHFRSAGLCGFEPLLLLRNRRCPVLHTAQMFTDFYYRFLL